MTDKELFRLSLLIPEAREKALAINAGMVKRGHAEPYIGSTVRTLSEQAEAVRRGTTGRRQILSWHLIRRAWDVRKRLANDQPDPTTHDEKFFLDLFWEARMVGVRNLGYVLDSQGHPVKLYINNGKVWDAGHCEFREPYKSLKEACAKEAPYLLGEHVKPDPDDDEEGSRLRALGVESLPPSPFK